MNKSPLATLLPVLAVITVLTVVVAVLWTIGFPMAGRASALFALVVAAALTLGMAYVFSHGPKTGH